MCETRCALWGDCQGRWTKIITQLELEQGAKVEVAHREGRTRSLQIAPTTCGRKSLTLYPIELGGRYLPSLTYIHVLTLYTH